MVVPALCGYSCGLCVQAIVALNAVATETGLPDTWIQALDDTQEDTGPATGDAGDLDSTSENEAMGFDHEAWVNAAVSVASPIVYRHRPKAHASKPSSSTGPRRSKLAKVRAEHRKREDGDADACGEGEDEDDDARQSGHAARSWAMTYEELGEEEEEEDDDGRRRKKVSHGEKSIGRQQQRRLQGMVSKDRPVHRGSPRTLDEGTSTFSASRSGGFERAEGGKGERRRDKRNSHTGGSMPRRTSGATEPRSEGHRDGRGSTRGRRGEEEEEWVETGDTRTHLHKDEHLDAQDGPPQRHRRTKSLRQRMSTSAEQRIPGGTTGARTASKMDQTDDVGLEEDFIS
jgi:hypothetical protein